LKPSVALNPIAVPEDLSRAKYELEAFFLGGEFDLYEDNRLICPVRPDQCAAEVSYQKLILSCWGDGWSRSWRVTSYRITEDRVVLQCTRRMGLARSAIEMRRGGVPGQVAETRADFAARLAGMVAMTFDGAKIGQAISARDDINHLSGAYARLLFNHYGQRVAAIGVSEAESQSYVDSVLNGALIWLSALANKGEYVDQLMILVPKDRATTLLTRMTALSSTASRISLYEVDEKAGAMEQIAPYDQGDLADRLRRAASRARWHDSPTLAPEAARLVDSVMSLAPDLIETRVRGAVVSLSIRGLEFARASTSRAELEYGLLEPKSRLQQEEWWKLRSLVERIKLLRAADSPDRNDPCFRLQSERWLESEIRRDVTVIDPTLDSRFVYSQVPAYRGEQRTFIDLLAVTEQGRLVVMELKVAEDVDFPFQALDYWLRVEWHRTRGDFERRGCFPGVRLADAPPLVYLIAPAFRFHGATGLLAKAISKRVPIYRVGINEDWRLGVRVLLRERLNSE
jgi:hypothetical protein